jgi:hypothetical protein
MVRVFHPRVDNRHAEQLPSLRKANPRHLSHQPITHQHKHLTSTDSSLQRQRKRRHSIRSFHALFSSSPLIALFTSFHPSSIHPPTNFHSWKTDSSFFQHITDVSQLGQNRFFVPVQMYCRNQQAFDVSWILRSATIFQTGPRLKTHKYHHYNIIFASLFTLSFTDEVDV